MLLQLENVGKSYGAIRALDDLSLTVERDEIVALLGPNGAGKTTVLEIALGLRRPDTGRVHLLGGSPDAPSVRRRLGATPQETGFPDELRVDELVRFASLHADDPPDVARTIERFGLGPLADRRAGALSGGESRRLAVALAFAGDPDLAVLDEPTTGMDVESRRMLWSVVRTAASGRSVLFTTHYLEEAEALATRVVVLVHGALLFDGTPQALRHRFGARRLSYVGQPLDPASAGIDGELIEIGGRVVVTTADTDAFTRALVGSATHFEALEIAPASLEEAFLSMTGAVR